MKKKKRVITAICSIAILTLAVSEGQKIQKRRTDGFSLSRLVHHMPYHEKYVGHELTLEENRHLAVALSQSYSYLGFGGQCFAFVSSDDRYVIKFFKQHQRGIKSLLNLPLPSSIKAKLSQKIAATKEKREKEFTSYMLAEGCLKEESGLIYTHLNTSCHLQKHLKIQDKACRTFSIPLDEYAFIIQKKAELIQPHLKKLMDEGKQDSARVLIHNIVAFFIARGDKGIYDDDARIHRNFGCIEQTPMLIDIGRLRREPFSSDRERMAKDIVKVNHHFIDWLKQSYPSLKEELDTELNALTESSSASKG